MPWFNQVLYQSGQGNLQDQSRLGDEQIKSSSAEKDLEVLVDERLNVSHPLVLAAQKTNFALNFILGL